MTQRKIKKSEAGSRTGNSPHGRKMKLTLRDARPTEGFYCTLDEMEPRAVYISRIATINEDDWLRGVVGEGYDAKGAFGPTYWRVAEREDKQLYCCTVIKDSRYYLLITELGLSDPWMKGAIGEVAVKNSWESLTPQGSLQ